MSVATIRSAIATLLETVSGVGEVNDHIPFGNDPDFFREHFCDADGRVNGWTVQVVPVEDLQRAGAVEHVYQITIRGILQVEEAEQSRATAETLCESIEAVFGKSIANRRLPKSGVNTVDYADPPTFAVQEAKVRGAGTEVACHVITCQFRAYADEAMAA